MLFLGQYSMLTTSSTLDIYITPGEFFHDVLLCLIIQMFVILFVLLLLLLSNQQCFCLMYMCPDNILNRFSVHVS